MPTFLTGHQVALIEPNSLNFSPVEREKLVIPSAHNQLTANDNHLAAGGGRAHTFKQNFMNAMSNGSSSETSQHDKSEALLQFQFADHEVLFDLTGIASQDEAAYEKLRALLADMMTRPVKVDISSKDQAQLLLFKNLELDFLAYKELSERLEMLAKLDHETESQKALAQQDRDRIRAVIASLHARLEKGQEALLGGTTLKALDVNRKDFELELDSLFTSVGFDSDMPVTGAT